MQGATITLVACVGLLLSVDAADDVAWFTVSRSLERLSWEDAPAVVCALDAFRFDVSFSTSKSVLTTQKNGFTWQLVAKEVAGWEPDAVVASGPLEVTFVRTEDDKQDELETGQEEAARETLQCEFDPEFCLPKLIGIRLPDVDAETEGGPSLQRGHSLELEFETPTNRPDVTSKEKIDRIVAFSEYVGDALKGMWAENGRVLVIKIEEIEEERVKPVATLMHGLLQTGVRDIKKDGDSNGGVEMISVEGFQSLRIEPAGRYLIRVGVLGAAPMWSPDLSVELCDSSYLVTYSGRATSDNAFTLNLTDLSFSIDGVITHGGNEGFVLPHAAIQMASPGSWSMSFWTFLTQDSTGNFRTLFFNGDGQREQRTPSAWWKPDERRLVLRVSTNESVDVGLDSIQKLPLNRWAHLGFTFVNCSQATNFTEIQIPGACPDVLADGENWSYSIFFYVNGMLDTKARIRDPVVGNSGPLHIGKGPWTDGMRGFTSNLKVFSVPISAAEHGELYSLEKRAHENYPELDCKHFEEINESVDIATAAKFPSTQISYLSQRFNCTGIHEEARNEHSKNFPEDIKFQELQASAYKKAVAARNSCESNIWDQLVEAADLGHPAACHDVGEAYLYGSYFIGDDCAVGEQSILVKQNLTYARVYLVKALVNGVLGAGKSLVLLLEMVDDGIPRTLLAPGLLHLSAASGQKDAFAMLGRRYRQYIAGNSAAVEIAAYHYYHAAVEASIAFHQLGKQPLHEMTRLYDSLERDLTVGERRNDDELIQFQKMRADKEGDVAAMAAMGDLYYWGAHGVPRDHAQAYQYFEQAARAGDVASQSAVAGMLLKGEGSAQDNAAAIKWYEKAAEKNHTRALNGLGFIHFHSSSGVPENKSRALEFFERAAANEEDGDSIFNAGYCHASGLGTDVNASRAMQFYDLAARKFGHFDAIFEIGKILISGVPGVVPRDSRRALDYLKAASEGGQWGSSMRKGFDLFVNNEYSRAVVLYHEARELGYPVATSNLAFLYDQRLRFGDAACEHKALKYLLLACEENGDRETLVRIGDYHYYGLAGLHKRPDTAIRWYSRASFEGVAAGAYNVGHMYEFGDGVYVNLERARRYYDRVMELSAHSHEIHVAIRFALARLSFHEWLQHTPFEGYFNSHIPLAQENKSVADSALAFSTAMTTFSGKIYAIMSTTAIIAVSVGVWYFRSLR